MRYLFILCVAAVLVGFDQLSKWVADTYIQTNEYIRITNFFNLVNVRNYGAAFGFLNDPSLQWGRWFLLGTTLLAVGVILWLARAARAQDRLLFFALACILGGAIGNFVDRIRLRAVVDFLDFHVAGWHWPAFNVADIAICLGAGLCVLLMLPTRRKER